MAKLLQQGEYGLKETPGEIKILTLGDNAYAWVDLAGAGEILVSAHQPIEVEHALTAGRYKLYDAGGEQHLELSIDKDTWRGYLLPTGLPDGKKVRSRIIPTKEVIGSKKTA